MNGNTIILDVSKQEDRLKIAFSNDKAALASYKHFSASMTEIDEICGNLTETMNVVSRNRRKGDFEKLRQEGRNLCDKLLPVKITDKLLSANAGNLILVIDDSLVHIPYELLCLNNEFLCMRFSMSRKVKTWQEAPYITERELKPPLSLGIVANPEANLAFAASEGEAIFKLVQRVNRENDPIIDPHLNINTLNPTPDDVKKKIRDFDLFHFTGHADYDPDNLEKCGWRLSQGVFSVKDIDNMAGGNPMPSLVFSNACQSARTQGWHQTDKKGSLDLANSFLRAGVQHYIGTIWKIADQKSKLFAVEFWELLCSGESVGEAVKNARINLTEKHGPNICWASYQLYSGYPTFRYFEKKRDHDLVQPIYKSDNPDILNLGIRGDTESEKPPPEKRVSGKSESKNTKIWSKIKIFTLVSFLLIACLIIAKVAININIVINLHIKEKQTMVSFNLEELSIKEQNETGNTFDELLKLATLNDTMNSGTTNMDELIQVPHAEFSFMENWFHRIEGKQNISAQPQISFVNGDPVVMGNIGPHIPIAPSPNPSGIYEMMYDEMLLSESPRISTPSPNPSGIYEMMYDEMLLSESPRISTPSPNPPGIYEMLPSESPRISIAPPPNPDANKMIFHKAISEWHMMRYEFSFEKKHFNPCTIAVVFDKKTEYLLENKEKFRIAIENQLQDELGSFYVVDLDTFRQTLDLNIMKYKQTPVDQREPVEIMLPKYLLTVGVVDYSQNTPIDSITSLFYFEQEIAIRCENTDERILIGSDFIKYEQGKPLINNSILEKLKKGEMKCD
ncbi:CHAT domain-containing protein [Desulfococcaceae bacterium HSG9]|nr:CHAT domain-containing protein [Desulfococcaceae bacterium HSG9]